MGGFASINTIKLYQEAIRRAGRDGLSMRLRLFGFLLLFLKYNHGGRPCNTVCHRSF